MATPKPIGTVEVSGSSTLNGVATFKRWAVDAYVLTEHFAIVQPSTMELFRGRWRITHRPSGFALLDTETLEEARTALRILERAPVNWTVVLWRRTSESGAEAYAAAYRAASAAVSELRRKRLERWRARQGLPPWPAQAAS